MHGHVRNPENENDTRPDDTNREKKPIRVEFDPLMYMQEISNTSPEATCVSLRPCIIALWMDGPERNGKQSHALRLTESQDVWLKPTEGSVRLSCDSRADD
jgi:hypothetical protein